MLKKRLKEDIGILTNTKALVFAALLTALSVAIGWVCKTYFTFGAIRVTFESMPVLLAGMMLGPFAGLAVGVASDLVSCLLSGYGVNPVITVGAGLIGIVSGIIYYNCNIKRKGYLSALVCVLPAHIIGSMAVKTLGLHMYGYAMPILLARIPLYIVISLVEAYIIYSLLRNPAITGGMARIRSKK